MKIIVFGVICGLATLPSSRLEGNETSAGDAPKSAPSSTTFQRWEKRQADLGLTLQIQLSKTSYTVGDAIQGEICIRNASRKPAKIFVPGLNGAVTRPPKVDINGALSTFTPLYFGRAAKGDQRDSIILQSGEYLGRHFHFPEFPAGEFEVSAFYARSSADAKYLLTVESPILRIVERP